MALVRVKYPAVSDESVLGPISNRSNLLRIDVNNSYIERVEANEKEGLKSIEITSGAYQVSGNPNRRSIPEEKEARLARTEQIHDLFVQKVSDNPGLDLSLVEQYSDGSVMLRRDPVEIGFVDEIGGRRDFLDATQS